MLLALNSLWAILQHIQSSYLSWLDIYLKLNIHFLLESSENMKTAWGIPHFAIMGILWMILKIARWPPHVRMPIAYSITHLSSWRLSLWLFPGFRVQVQNMVDQPRCRTLKKRDTGDTTKWRENRHTIHAKFGKSADEVCEWTEL